MANITVPTSPQFLQINIAELVNLDLVRRIIIVDSFNYRLLFDKDDFVDVTGEAAKALKKHLNRFHTL